MQKNKQLISGIMLLICLLFLGGSFFFSWNMLKNNAPERTVITVWMPLPDNMSEQDAQTVFERLTQGFEKQYPDFGVDLFLYADDSYEEVLRTQSGVVPAVFMNIPEQHQLPTADLSEFTERLGDWYITDMTDFRNCIPLSWSIPVLYTNDMTITENSITKENLPVNTITEITDFQQFLEHPEISVLSESSQLALVQNCPSISGAVQMIPVSENNIFQIYYHDYCCVNTNADENQQKIGKLWIGYLLSEEAQQILFTEHFYHFPLHEHAFEMMVSQHQGLAVLSEIRENIASVNQERRQ